MKYYVTIEQTKVYRIEVDGDYKEEAEDKALMLFESSIDAVKDEYLESIDTDAMAEVDDGLFGDEDEDGA